ncbi:MAG: UDP-N-acetylmuramoyl-L-alanine--D-glutamate ligase [bacterium]|nr:UDP-N-acetylmuramoyl-L-alanine--D-glutamate ligase [bacterium]
MVKIMEVLKKEYQNKKVLVVGLGIQGGGLGVARFFAQLGAKVKVTDLKNETQLSESLDKLKLFPRISYTLGKHDIKDFLDADVIFKGPSVRWDLPEMKAAQEHNIPVEMETSFFASLSPASVIGITGTRGKSTTTQLIYELLKETGRKVYLAGNIPGVSTIELLNIVKPSDTVVLELSSWQLSGFHHKKVSPHIAIFTNIYPDHLNYYSSMDNYFYDKSAIFAYQKKEDILIASPNLKSHIEEIVDSTPVQKIEYILPTYFPADLQYLKGIHNKENASLALKTAEHLGIAKEKSIEIISQFKGLPYRQEIIGEKEKVIFINDTTSTTPIATVRAIETFTDRPVVLILGGNAKGLPTDDLLHLLHNVSKIILLKGSFTNEILSKLLSLYISKVDTTIYSDLGSAVRKAYDDAKRIAPAYVLFSPGATSFASFKNEFDRGDQFNTIVASL